MKKFTVIMLCAVLFVPLSAQANENPVLTPMPHPTSVLVTDLTPQAEETAVYAEPQDESPYAAAFFNISYYTQKNPDLVAVSGGNEGLLRAHWLNYGNHEGRRGSPSFNAKWYLANYPDLAAFGSDYAQAALHYRSIGVAQGQAGSAEFDPDDYTQLNPDLAAQYGNDLRALAQHYNDQGFAEGRLAFIEVETTAASQVEAVAEQQPAETQEPEAAADALEPGTANPWPVVQNTLHKLKTIDKGDQRAMAYRGPGKNYREANAFRTSKMTRVNGLFIEGMYILTEMDYAGVGKRRLYFMIGTFTKTGNIPVWDMEGFGAYTAADAFPRYGPGEDYNDFGGEVLPAGSPVIVFFEENGWVFMEFMSSQGLDRGWVPSEFVVPAIQPDGSHVTVITPLPVVSSTPRPTATSRPVTEGPLPVTPYPITPEPDTPVPDTPESFSLLPSYFDTITIAPPSDVQPLSVSAVIDRSSVSSAEENVYIFVDSYATGGSGDYEYIITLYSDNHPVNDIRDNHVMFTVPPSARGHTYKARVEVFDGLTWKLVYTGSIWVE